MDLKDIKQIIDLMTRNGLTEFELERDNAKIRIKRGLDDAQPQVTQLQAATSAPTPAVTSAASAPDTSHLKEIKSPMVGSFYRSPSPEAPSYVEVGQAVTEDTVVCIIEAMKVMNEIKAEVSGIITEILIENGKPVEFGKPMFRVKPN